MCEETQDVSLDTIIRIHACRVLSDMGTSSVDTVLISNGRITDAHDGFCPYAQTQVDGVKVGLKVTHEQIQCEIEQTEQRLVVLKKRKHELATNDGCCPGVW